MNNFTPDKRVVPRKIENENSKVAHRMRVQFKLENERMRTQIAIRLKGFVILSLEACSFVRQSLFCGLQFYANWPLFLYFSFIHISWSHRFLPFCKMRVGNGETTLFLNFLFSTLTLYNYAQWPTWDVEIAERVTRCTGYHVRPGPGGVYVTDPPPSTRGRPRKRRHACREIVRFRRQDDMASDVTTFEGTWLAGVGR